MKKLILGLFFLACSFFTFAASPGDGSTSRTAEQQSNLVKETKKSMFDYIVVVVTHVYINGEYAYSYTTTYYIRERQAD